MNIVSVLSCYDIWFGFYWDCELYRLYCMIPFVGFYLEFKSKYRFLDEKGEMRNTTLSEIAKSWAKKD